MQGAYPPGHLVLAHGVEDIAELLYFRGQELVGGYAAKAVQFLVVVIFHILAHGCQKAVLLACLVHAATFGIRYNHSVATFCYFLVAHTRASLNPAFFMSSQNEG